jgi:16S rRNA (guanine(1405)-N(7))-methyltransferase
MAEETRSGSTELDALVATVRQSPKYRAIAPELIRRTAARELAKRRKPSEALQATRQKLHQVAGAYLPLRAAYPAWLAELRRAHGTGEPDAARAACARVMAQHASTRERLAILDRFHAETLRTIAPVRSVLDVACGLHPLSIPWMPLAPGAVYHAWEIYEDMVAFLNQYFAIAGVAGRAELRDALAPIPAPEVDLALILKALPCLEQLDPDAGARLLDALPARRLLVSFPSQTLCGRRKGMGATYEARFQSLMAGRSWPVQRFDFPGELAFLVTKG